MCVNEPVKGRGWLIESFSRKEEWEEAIWMQKQPGSPLSPSPLILSAFSYFQASSSPLSFALRLAATADLNNSAQASILQGPIVCARQENEKER